MDVTKKKVLNGYHVVFLVQNVMIGMGLLSFNQVVSPLGYSQWWIPLFFGVLANITLIPMVWLALQYKEDDLFDIHEKLLGKKIGKLLNILLIVYVVLVIASVLQNYLDLIQIAILPDRSNLFHSFFILLLAVLIVNGGIKSVARFCIFTFFFTIGLVYFLRWGYVEGEISHLLPLFNFSISEFLEATKLGYSSMVGYELILVYFPYIINQKKVFKQASLGIWITVLIYFMTSVVAVMYFSEWQLKHMFYPVLELFQAVRLSFVERIDTIGITIWVFLILSTISAYIWVVKKGIESVRAKNSQYHIYFTAVCVYVLISLPFSQTIKKTLHENIFYVSYGIILWPVFLCMIHFLRKEKKGVVK
ncbi:GerAB/ArcD/ProY family transporter [Paenisporosarcina antarctica]|uniref:Spore gernimation protein n=1 Tax=Paenisporosarcina antarctica TaxID=417367 RepID=A0A4P7A2Y0_9BACL|nr:GerAB/ArcD/ProY family transporter [Paenisporosarcina antarctica]QBP42316.1 spore gernimation protein [Paenisporosarcina antarctica]